MENDKSWYSSLNFLRLAEIAVILSVIISGYILFTYERKNHDPDYNKSWVAFYFIDPSSPENGVKAENHLGKDTDFRFCLVPDSNDLMEPNDLSCNLNTVVELSEKNITAGSNFNWKYKTPGNNGKYWVMLEYKDGDVLKNKDLSFEVR